MSNYNTRNAVPSTDPRDLDDNATNFDLLLMSDAASVPDRLGELRKTWAQMERDAQALIAPNVSALAAAVAGVNKGLYFSATSPVAISTYDLGAYVRSISNVADGPAFRAAIGAVGAADNITGSAATLTTPRTIAASGDATWSVTFNGSANVTAALTLANTGVTAGTYGAVTVDAKGRATGGSIATPIANGGTGATTQSAALSAILGSSAIGFANGGTGATTQSAALSAILGSSTVGLANGGTGATTASAARTNLGLGTAAVATIGTSGNNVPLLNTANSWSASQAMLGATPVTDGGSNLGTASLRWATVYAVTGTINTSDGRLKTPVRELTESELAAAVELGKMIGMYKWLSAVESKADAARDHVGMTVQSAIDCMQRNGLDPFGYGFICYDEFEDGDRYGFRMDELNAFIAAGFNYRLTLLEGKM